MKEKIFFLYLFIITTTFGCANQIYEKDLTSYSLQEKNRVSLLVQRLGAPSWKERNQSSEALIHLGSSFIPLIKHHLSQANLEQKWRIRYVLSELGWVEPKVRDTVESSLEEALWHRRNRSFLKIQQKKQRILSYGHPILPILLEKLKTPPSSFEMKSLCLELIEEMENKKMALSLAKILLSDHPLHSSLCIVLGRMGNPDISPYLAYSTLIHEKNYGGKPFCAESLIGLLGEASFPFLLDYWESKGVFYYKKEILEIFREKVLGHRRKKGFSDEETLSKEDFLREIEKLKNWWKREKNNWWNLREEGYFKEYLELKKKNGRCQT